MDSHIEFGGIVDTPSSYFEQNRHRMYTEEHGGGPNLDAVHTVSVDISIILYVSQISPLLVYVTNITSVIHLNNAT